MHAKQPGLHGLCLIGERRALIRITSDTEQMMLDSLVHEWCHVLRDECPLPWEEDEHDAVYWAIYGHVNNHWLRE